MARINADQPEPTTASHSGGPALNGADLLHEGSRSGIFTHENPPPPGSQAAQVIDGFSIGDKQTDPKEPRPVSDAASPQPISDSATPQQRADWVRNPNNLESTDLNRLWNKETRVLGIGDSHSTMSTKDWTIDNMRAMANQGATAFGMEFLPRDSQQQLREYAELRRQGPSPERDKAREDLVKLMTSQQRGLNEKIDPELETPLQHQFDMVDAAIDANMRPLALEPNIDGMWAGGQGFDLMQSGSKSLSQSSQLAFDKYNNRDTADADRSVAAATLQKDLSRNYSEEQVHAWFATMDQARKADFNFSDIKVGSADAENDQRWDERGQDMRNRAWASAGAEYLRDHPNGKLVMFAGAAHFQYGRNEGPLGQVKSVNERLSDSGYHSTVLQFAGGDNATGANYTRDENDGRQAYWERHSDHRVTAADYGKLPDIPDHVKFPATRWTDTAYDTGLHTKRFAIQVAPTAVRSADWVIHLPQDRTGRK